MATSSIGELDAADQREPGSPHVVVHAHNSSVNIYNGTMPSEGGAARLHTTQGVLQVILSQTYASLVTILRSLLPQFQ